MALDYLDFDFSADADGGGSFDAMASVAAAHWPALQSEALRVLDWGRRTFGAPTPLEDGGEWDCALHAVREVVTPLAVEYVPGAPELHLHPGHADAPRITLTVTLSGSESFCAAFREAFPSA